MDMMHKFGISLKMEDNHWYIGTCIFRWLCNDNELFLLYFSIDDFINNSVMTRYIISIHYVLIKLLLIVDNIHAYEMLMCSTHSTHKKESLYFYLLCVTKVIGGCG